MKRITIKQQNFIVEHYQKYSDSELAKMLDVSKYQISELRYKLGLSKKGFKKNVNALTYAEKKYIQDNYMNIPYKDIAKHLNRGISVLVRYVKQLYEKGYP